MNFGEAVATIRENVTAKVQRSGWNGKGMYLAIVFGSSGTVGHKSVSFEPFIVMKTADEKFVPWLASQTDVLASDWQLVP